MKSPQIGVRGADGVKAGEDGEFRWAQRALGGKNRECFRFEFVKFKMPHVCSGPFLAVQAKRRPQNNAEWVVSKH